MSGWWQQWKADNGDDARKTFQAAVWATLSIILVVLAVWKDGEQSWLPKQLHGEYQLATVLLLGLAGWWAIVNIGRVLHIQMRRRSDPNTAGMVEFSVKFFGLLIVGALMLHELGLQPKALLLGGAITAGLFIVTARDPIGNVVAGFVLFSSRSYRIGDRVRIQGGTLAGTFEGTVVRLGLAYTIFEDNGNTTMIPNSLLVSAAVTPLDDVPAVDMIAELRPGITPARVQQLLDQAITIPLRGNGRSHVELQAVTEHVVVRIVAAPQDHTQGGIVAEQVLLALAPVARTADISPKDTEEFDAVPTVS